MASIADSGAFLDPERMLAQHQAALTLLQGMLADPGRECVRWLDLASGRGQIISQLKEVLTDRARAKLHFCGYDIDNRHTRDAEKIAQSMGLADCRFGIGELCNFRNSESVQGPWDFITLTNTVHEINPESLAGILVGALEELEDSGCLFAYDMERLPSPELGAILWTRNEIFEILSALSSTLGCETYEPVVGKWTHRTCFGWNAQINLAHMQLPGDWKNRTHDAVEETARQIGDVLQRKLLETRKALEALTRFGPETGGETTDKENLLFDFWAITRALEEHT